MKGLNPSDVVFTKKSVEILLARVKTSRDEIVTEITSLRGITSVTRSERLHQGKLEIRYQCYFIYSNARGRCYIVTLNGQLKIITVYPIGRATIRRYRRALNRRTSKKGKETI
jgi:hypothetical protein